ncbi:recombinase family protein [Geobacter pelophilus]|uniref:Recombinase family protein n=1 Tax=Geoanaerobacter pelophilus TaxID=60036 RepID=A0AAW4L855_9BACT|nr:recombinase family protein [Geoanaerobacter pelophilus]MBT0664209.1 recombinase family protein [Geoanaerobacter pelophilus]
MANGKFVGYIRVSTAKQGASGLGLEAQRKAINDYLNGGSWELIAEYVEVESGKLNERQELQKAFKHCQVTGATLVIAKLDRLSRDSHFIGSVMKSGIEFVACDMPAANKFTIHILAAVAEHEREMISQRTKAALQAAKARGKTLGNPGNLNQHAAAMGRVLGVQARQGKANDFAGSLSPIIQDYTNQGMSLNQMARELNNRGILTARGKQGSWTPTAVKNAMARLPQAI